MLYRPLKRLSAKFLGTKQRNPLSGFSKILLSKMAFSLQQDTAKEQEPRSLLNLKTPPHPARALVGKEAFAQARSRYIGKGPKTTEQIPDERHKESTMRGAPNSSTRHNLKSRSARDHLRHPTTQRTMPHQVRISLPKQSSSTCHTRPCAL